MNFFILMFSVLFTQNTFAYQEPELLISKKTEKIIFSANEFVGGADWWSADLKSGNIAIFTSTGIPNEHWAYRRNKLKFIKINPSSDESSKYWELTPSDLNSELGDFYNGFFLGNGNWFVVSTHSKAYILDLTKKEFYPLPMLPDHISDVKLSTDGEVVLFPKEERPSANNLYSYNLKTKIITKISSVPREGSGLMPTFRRFGFVGKGESKVYVVTDGGSVTKSKFEFFNRSTLFLEKVIFIADGAQNESLGRAIHFNENHSILSLTVGSKINDKSVLKLVKIDLLNQLKLEVPLPNNDNLEGYEVSIITKSANADDLIVQFGNRYLVSTKSLKAFPMEYLFSASAYLGFIVNLTNTALPKGYPNYLIYDSTGKYLNTHPCSRVSYDYSWIKMKPDGISCLSNPEYKKARILYSINDSGETSGAYRLPDEFEDRNIEDYQLKEISNRTLLRLFSNQLRISFY